MSAAGRSRSLIGGTMATLCMYFGPEAPALADDCAQRFFDFRNMLQLPGAVLEDCMRTSYIQAFVTLVLGSFGGFWIARSLFGKLGQGQPGPELPAVSRRDLVALVNKIEEEAAKQGYHEGVKDRIESALDEVQAEIVRLGRGNLPPEEAALLKVRLAALLWSLSRCLDPNNTYKYKDRAPSLPNSASPFNPNDWKCNKLVADAYSYGAGLGLSQRPGQTGYPVDPPKSGKLVWPPQANDVARPNANLRNFTNARDCAAPDTPGADPRAVPRPGDVVAFPAAQGSGHVTIYLGNGLVVGAKELEGATIETLESEQLGHGNTARVRQYTGSGR